MPKTIKLAILLLFGSACMSACGTYLDVSLLTEDGGLDPYIYLVDLFWFCVITWIAWDIAVKKKDVRLTVVLVALIIVGFCLVDYSEFGLSVSLYAYALEAAMYPVIYILLSCKQSQAWYVDSV